MLLDAKNRKARGNRRIEIMVLTKSASDTLYQYFGQHGDKVVQPAGAKAWISSRCFRSERVKC